MTGFEFPSIVRGMGPATQENGYTMTWATPEVLEGADAITREADVFAFGTVVTEVCPCALPHLLLEVGGLVIFLTSNAA